MNENSEGKMNDLLVCPNCNGVNHSDCKFCTQCGMEIKLDLIQNNSSLEKATSNICKNCNTKNSLESHFCIECGNKLDSSDNFNNDQSIVSNNEESIKNKFFRIGGQIFLGIILLVISLYVPGMIFVLLIAGIFSLFSKKSRAFGLTILSFVFAAVALVILLFIFLVGACAGGF